MFFLIIVVKRTLMASNMCAPLPWGLSLDLCRIRRAAALDAVDVDVDVQWTEGTGDEGELTPDRVLAADNAAIKAGAQRGRRGSKEGRSLVLCLTRE